MGWLRTLTLGTGLLTTSVVGGVGLWYRSLTSGDPMPAEYWADRPTRQIPGRQLDGLQLTLFQYQTCPFCCKVRAYMDYNGLAYNVVEVNSVSRQQTRWITDYSKVPVLYAKPSKSGQGSDDEVVLKDSSVIVSALESRLRDPSQSLAKLRICYPGIVGEEGAKLSYPNRYFVMQPGKKVDEVKLKEEQKWRRWVDDVFVHVISPNIYRTIPEALDTFRWFSKAGDWERCFSTAERALVVYVGAVAMRLVSVRLSRRHGLQADVRQSLYSELNTFLHSLGKQRFRGGDRPDLSDLAMYGVLSAMEGTAAFADAQENCPRLRPWYQGMRTAIGR